jgi:hypothetical protein
VSAELNNDVKFDYDRPDVPDEVHRAVCAEMAGTKLQPLTDEEIAQREIEREIQRAEYARYEQETAARHERERVARAEQERAEWLAEHRKAEAVRQRERAQEIERLTTQRSLSDLRMSAAKRDAFERDVRNSHTQGVRQQHLQRLMDEWGAMINAPKPEVSDSFAARYRNNQRSGWYYTTPEDTDE